MSRSTTRAATTTAASIYCAPISVLNEQGQVAQNFDAIVRLPMVKLADKGSRTPNGIAWQRLREFVHRRLPPEHFDHESTLDRLIAHSGGHPRDLLRLLEHGDGFQLVFALCLSIAYRQRIIDEIAVRHPATMTVDLHDASDPSALIDALRGLAAERQPIHVVGVEAWLRRAGPPALQALNYRRESLAAAVRRTLVVWLEPGTITRFAREAPDLWAWRAAVLDFSHPPAQRAAVHEQAIFLGSAERRERERRLADIAAHLQSVAGPAEPAGPDAELMLEASEIEQELGHPEAAMAHAEAARAIFRRIDDRRGEAWAASRIADILQARGQLDEGLRIRLEEELPVYERLGDVRSKAVTHFQIASLRLARNEQQSEEGRLAIFASLRQAYDIALQMRIPDGISAVGPLFAQFLAMGQAFAPALQVLAKVDEACATLGDEAGRQRAADLRQQIEAMQAGQA